MQTECISRLFEFEAVGRHAVVADFDGGDITSKAGRCCLGRSASSIASRGLRRPAGFQPRWRMRPQRSIAR